MLFSLFSLFLLFFTLNFSLRFDFVIFASKRNEGKNFFASKEAKFNIFSYFLLPNYASGEKKKILSIFSLNFRFALIFSLNFRLFYLRFCFRFLVFRIEVNHVKASFFSLQCQISLQKRKWGRTLVPISTFMCLWAIYIFSQSICLFCCRKYADRSWEYENPSQKHECGNWDWGRAIPRKGIYKWDFRCSVENKWWSRVDLHIHG